MSVHRGRDAGFPGANHPRFVYRRWCWGIWNRAVWTQFDLCRAPNRRAHVSDDPMLHSLNVRSWPCQSTQGIVRFTYCKWTTWRLWEWLHCSVQASFQLMQYLMGFRDSPWGIGTYVPWSLWRIKIQWSNSSGVSEKTAHTCLPFRKWVNRKLDDINFLWTIVLVLSSVVHSLLVPVYFGEINSWNY